MMLYSVTTVLVVLDGCLVKLVHLFHDILKIFQEIAEGALLHRETGLRKCGSLISAPSMVPRVRCSLLDEQFFPSANSVVICEPL